MAVPKANLSKLSTCRLCSLLPDGAAVGRLRPFQRAVRFRALGKEIVFIICFIVSWSAKGKQLAIALQSGDIITFSPSETQQAKSFVARPSSMQGHSIIHTTWLSNPAFYAIFSPVGPLDPQADQKHMIIVHDTKRSDASADITLPINFFPSGIRPPGAFTIALKGWDPAKILLLVGDSTTSDIGLVCCTAEDKWQKLSFDEGAPSMPLDADQNETTMIGFELDLKNTTPYDVTTSTGETVSVPPPPVVWAYASDGTVVAWYVVNTRGTPYSGKGQPAVRSPVVAPAAAVPEASPFSPVVQPTFGQPFGLSTFSGQPASSFGTSTPSFGQSGFGQTSTTGPAFGQAPTFGNSAFGAASSTFGQASPPGPTPSGGPFAAFASSLNKWGQTGFGSAPTGFISAAAPAPPAQIQPAESTESMSTDSSQELSFGGMSLGEGTDDTQAKAGSGTTSMFGAPTPPSQSAPSQATNSTFGSGSFLSPGVGAFSKYAAKPADDTTSSANVEVPKPSPAFGQTSFASGFGQSGFGQASFGQSGFGKTGLGTPMSTTPIVTPVNPTSPSAFGSGGAFGAFASGGLATFGGAKPAETKSAVPAISPGGAFGAFASGGVSAFGQAASNKPDSVPAWKTGGDATFNSGTGTTVFGGTPSAPPVAPSTTPVKSMFTSAEPTATTTPTATPLGAAASPEKGKSSSPFASTTSSTTPSTTPVPTQKSQSPPALSSTPTATPQPATDSAKLPAPLASTTPVGTPPAANAFMSLKMSTGFGLSNFNAKDSPFSNPKPVSQTVSAFGDQSSAPKVPVPATPGSVFGQTSVMGTPPKPSSGFAQPAFGSPSTPSASPNTTPSTSKTPLSNAFSAFSGSSASAFGKTGGSGVAFSDMLRAGGSSPESKKSKEPSKTFGLASGSTTAAPKSAFDASPTPQPAKIPTSHGSDDEDEEKGKGQTVSAGSSFSNLSSSSSFVDVSRGGEEEEEAEAASDDGDSERGEQQIDDFLSDTYSEGESDRERDQVEDEEGDEERKDGDESDEDHGSDEEQGGTGDADNEVPPSDEEVDPAAVPLPASRSPSSTPRAERPSINVQPTEPSPKASLPEQVRTTSPPGSPPKEHLSLQTPLQQPTPTLPSPSPSLSPSPASAISFGRPNTRPLRSSPLANTPVSGGDEEEVKGEKPASLKPHPASPKPPFGQWDGSAMPPSPSPPEVKPTPPEPVVEPLVDQTAKATPSAITRPKTPPLLIGKGIALNDTSSSSAVAAAVVPVASPMPTLNLGGFPLGTAVKPDTKPPVEDPTKPATTPATNLFPGLKPGAFSLLPKTEPPASDTKATPIPGPLFASNHTAALGATAKLPLVPATGSSFFAKPGAATAVVTTTGGKSAMSTPARVSTAPPLVTPPKDAPSGEPLNPIQIEFTNLITEIGTELANVRPLSILALFIAHVTSLRPHSLASILVKPARGDLR